MNKKLLIVGAAALAVSSVSAMAADLPSRKAPPVYLPPPAIFTWTGVYVGGQVGYAFGRDGFGSPVGAFGSYNPTGVIGGAHVGYNYQVNQFVVGLEGDVNGASYKGTDSFVFGVPRTFTSRIGIDGSVRGRIGFAYDKALFYATGGAAFAGITNNYSGPLVTSSSNHTRVGYTVGGGIEYAIDRNWSLRAEYRFTDYGRYSDAIGGTLTPVTNHETEQRVQAGFSYKFDMMAPPTVVAKY